MEISTKIDTENFYPSVHQSLIEVNPIKLRKCDIDSRLRSLKCTFQEIQSNRVCLSSGISSDCFHHGKEKRRSSILRGMPQWLNDWGLRRKVAPFALKV